MKYSQSTIERYLICPRRFYYYVMGCPRIQIKTPQSEVGQFIHSLIEEFFNRVREENIILSPSEVEKIGKIMNEEYDLESDPVKFSMWKNFIDYQKEKLLQPELIEQKIEDDKFIGIIDFYSKDGILIDWKTTSPDKMNNEKLLIQASIYYHLLTNVLRKPVREIRFVYLQGIRYVEQVVNPDLAYLSQIVSELDLYVQKIRNGEISVSELEKPPKKIYCLNCEYRVRCFCDENKISWWML